MFSSFDPSSMRLALDLAARGRGKVEPNPMVGCVIARDGQIIGQGWHQRFGQAHAEPNALASCTASPAGATAYVTLEPCCHTHKKTPPCVPALIAAKIARVVVATADPNPDVAGQGIAQLRSAGIAVETGLLEAEARQLNAPFFARIVHQRPYVTLKWAQSADGKVAGPAGQRRQISNPASMRLVHELRSRCDAILVGIGTVLADDPLLTVRGVEGGRQPLRIVLDSNLRLPLESKLVQTARDIPTLVFCSPKHADTPYAAALKERGILIMPDERSARRLDKPFDDSKSLEGRPRGPYALSDVLGHLHERNVTHLLVEPGPTLAASFLRENLADRLWVFHSPASINSPTAPAAPSIPYPPTAQIDLDGDLLTEHLNPASPVFFAPTASADIMAVTDLGR